MTQEFVCLADLESTLRKYLADLLVDDIVEEMKDSGMVIHSAVITDKDESNAYIERLSRSLKEARGVKHRLEEKLFANRSTPDPTLFEIYYGFDLVEHNGIL